MCIRIRGNADLFDVMVGDPCDLHVQGLKVKRSAGFRKAAKLLHDPAAPRPAFQKKSENVHKAFIDFFFFLLII